IHFHVPIFLAELKPFENTQSFLRELLALHASIGLSQHLEVETYTWEVLPAAWRQTDVEGAIARELSWAKNCLGEP
ncbi:MAG: sugar phosphate isomerase, partial [Deltaproteobacteria bacterium]